MRQSAVSAPVRWLVHVLSLLLVPVVVLAMPNVAQAAPLGDWATAVFDEPVGGPIPGSINCAINARWVEGTGGGTSIQVGAGSGCYSPGYYNSWEPGTAYTLSFQGSSCEGREFTSSWMTGANHDWNSNHMVVGTSMEVPAGSCVPSSVCVQGASTDTTKLCGSISLGLLEAPVPTGCALGQPLSVNVLYFNRNGATSGVDGQIRVDFAAGVSTSGWGAEIAMRGNGGVLRWLDAGTSSWSGNSLTVTFPTRYPGSFEPFTAIGVDVLNAGSGPAQWQHTPPLTLGSPEGGGWTVTTRCKYYFGEKIAPDEPTETRDDPAGALGAAVVPDNPEPISTDDPPADGDSDSCTFSWGDPSTWASAGICALVHLMARALGVLGDIWTAVRGVAGAILGGLAELFVPDDIAWEGMWTQVQARPPFSVLADLVGAGDELADGFKAGSGSCGTVADFTPEGVPAGSGAIDCNAIRDSDGMSVLYGLVSAALIGLTAFSAWRMLQSSIGGRNA